MTAETLEAADEYDDRFTRAMRQALVVMARERLSPPISTGWQPHAPGDPTLYLHVHEREFVRWYTLLQSPTSHSTESGGSLHLHVYGYLPSFVRAHVVALTELPTRSDVVLTS